MLYAFLEQYIKDHCIAPGLGLGKQFKIWTGWFKSVLLIHTNVLKEIFAFIIALAQG